MRSMMSSKATRSMKRPSRSRMAFRLGRTTGRAEVTGRSLMHRLQQMTSRTERATKVAGGALGLGLLTSLLGSDDERQPAPPTRHLTDGFLDEVAQAVKQRLQGGSSLHDALGLALEERAPIVLRPASESGSSGVMRTTKVGLVLALGLGLLYGMRRLRSGRLREDTSPSASGSQAETQYRTVHQTAGAKLPEPVQTGSARQPRVANTPGGRMPETGDDTGW